MKNLLHIGLELEDDFGFIKFELPKEEITRKRWDDYHHSQSDCHRVDGIYPWTRIIRIAEKYIGKSADEAFSIYCSQVPKYQQHFFWESVAVSKEALNAGWHLHPFYVDSDGNLQKVIRFWKSYRNRKPIYYSDDYRTELRHKVTGKKKPEFFWLYKEEDFIPVIVSGYAIEFDSKKDKTYKRLMSEQRKRKALRRLADKKAKEEKEYSFISKTEQRKKKEKEIDKIKIVAKGFDPETSFRTEKQINPDTIKEKQGF
jgi:hypothetical protein